MASKCDKRVSKLVTSLNKLPGITTFSSCGGHDNPETGQMPIDSFYVNCIIDLPDQRPSRDAWVSIGIIERAISNANFDSGYEYSKISNNRNFNMTFWNDSEVDDINGIIVSVFEIKGISVADPDLLSVYINNIRKKVLNK